MDAQKLIANVVAAYESFESYSDLGSCTPDLSELPAERPFSFQTHFVRPNKFRFHWTMTDPQSGKAKSPRDFVLWTNGTTFQNKFFEETENSQSLSMLVAGATGISGGSVHQILNILLPRTLGLSWGWQDMREIDMLEDELVNGADCFHLTGTTKTAHDTEIWIEKGRLLVRRLREKHVMTEENCRDFEVQMQSEEFSDMEIEAMKKQGMSPEAIAKAISDFKNYKMEPSITYSVYEFTSIAVNEPIDNVLFEQL